MRSSASQLAGLLLLLSGCSDDQPFQPERSVRVELEALGLPEGAAAEYRILVEDTVAIAHGAVANGETDTVRISSSAPLDIRWQDARATVGDVDYVFAPAQREAGIEGSAADTTVVVLGSYALASGGFALTTPGLPVPTTALWRVWIGNDSLLAYGDLVAGAAIRRGDLPPGSVRLELDTAYVELGGVRHAYNPPLLEIPLSVSASLELLPVEAPYNLASVVLRVSASGLPAGTPAPWGFTTITSDYSVGGSTLAGTVQTVDLIPPGSYTAEWGEVIVDGVRYLANPSAPMTLQPRTEPYQIEGMYAPAP